jgi:predicted enzyme related to lactoylglutathione lyase
MGRRPIPLDQTQPAKRDHKMTVKRITVNINTDQVQQVAAFYADLFDLTSLMDQGWIATLGHNSPTQPQINIASEGGSGTVTPDISIEVENVDETHARALRLGHKIEYRLTDEPWGVRRFYLRDPAGTLINVLSHKP